MRAMFKELMRTKGRKGMRWRSRLSWVFSKLLLNTCIRKDYNEQDREFLESKKEYDKLEAERVRTGKLYFDYCRRKYDLAKSTDDDILQFFEGNRDQVEGDGKSDTELAALGLAYQEAEKKALEFASVFLATEVDFDMIAEVRQEIQDFLDLKGKPLEIFGDKK